MPYRLREMAMYYQAVRDSPKLKGRNKSKSSHKQLREVPETMKNRQKELIVDVSEITRELPSAYASPARAL